MKRHVIRVAVAAAMLVATGQAAGADALPVVAPNDLAGWLKANGVAPALDFTVNRPIECISGSAGKDWAYHCVVGMADGTRGGRTAAVEVMIFAGGYDFAARDAQLKAAVKRMGGRWSLDYQPEVNVKGEGRTIALKGACHQSRGRPNSLAFCLLPIAANVLVFTQVPPAEATSDRVITSQNGDPDSFDDMARAGSLASLGAVAVAKALDARRAGR